MACRDGQSSGNSIADTEQVLAEAHGPVEEFQKVRVEQSELLELLRSAGLEEWYSKFLSFGYETVEDVRRMDEHCIQEIGLHGEHRTASVWKVFCQTNW